MQCPRDDQGRICRASIPALSIEVYACDRCHAMWTHPATIGALTFVDLDQFLATHDVEGGWAALTDVRDDWAIDPSVAAARAAVEADPESVAARLSLAAALFKNRDQAAALEQFTLVLAREPANLAAL